MGHRHLIKGLLLLFLIVALVGTLESFPVSHPRSVPKKRTPSKGAPEEEAPAPGPAKPKAM